MLDNKPRISRDLFEFSSCIGSLQKNLWRRVGDSHRKNKHIIINHIKYTSYIITHKCTRNHIHNVVRIPKNADRSWHPGAYRSRAT